MAEELSQKQRLAPEQDDVRAMPFIVAGSVCLFTAILLGYGGWYVFGTNSPLRTKTATDSNSQIIVTSTTPAPGEVQSVPTPAVSPEAPSQSVSQPEQPITEALKAPAGELLVAGGEVVMGGEGTNRPVQRQMVADFQIGETEVTNEQYQEFLRATNRQLPAAWKDGAIPAGQEKFPVTAVTQTDATEYCRWLGTKIGAEVRLPSEAEWERAARGKDNYKYPWGNEWNDTAAAYWNGEANAPLNEKLKKISAVKTFAANVSPFGAYDMAGNVWEWTADEARDAAGQPRKRQGITIRVVKGGAAVEDKANISAAARVEIPENVLAPIVGFRYVVIRKKDAATAQNSE